MVQRQEADVQAQVGVQAPQVEVEREADLAVALTPADLQKR